MVANASKTSQPGLSEQFREIAQRMLPKRPDNSLFKKKEYQAIWGLRSKTPLPDTNDFEAVTDFIARLHSRFIGLKEIKIDNKRQGKGPHPKIDAVIGSLGSSSFNYCRERYCLSFDDEITARWDEGYYGDPDNFYRGMTSSYSGDVTYTIGDNPDDKKQQLMFMARALNFSLMDHAVHKRLNIVYRPVDMDAAAEELLSRIRDRGYAQHSIIMDAPLEDKIARLRANFDDHKYAFTTQEDMIAEIIKQHNGLADHIRNEIHHSGTYEILWWEGSTNNVRKIADFNNGQLQIHHQQALNNFMMAQGLTRAELQLLPYEFPVDTAEAKQAQPASHR